MAYLENPPRVAPADRGAAAGVYKKYKQPFPDVAGGLDPLLEAAPEVRLRDTV